MTQKPPPYCPGGAHAMIARLTQAKAAAAAPDAQDAAAAIELAYGLLWLCSSNRATRDGERIYQARQALLALLDRDGKLRGLNAAQDLEARNQERIPER